MRFLLALLLLIPFGLNAATAFTEFYCDYGVGTNINSGSTTNAAATYTSVNGNFNGSSTFTPTDGSTPASTVSAGDWAAIYVDGATNLVQASSGGYIVRVLSVAAGANGAITVSTTAFAGTAPSSSATGRSIKVGGAWNGPYGTIAFPFNFLATTATNGPAALPRCNMKNTSQYNITASMAHTLAGPVVYQGMTLHAGDGGKATFDGGTSGVSYIILNISGANIDLTDFIFTHNGASGSSTGVSIGQECTITRCVVNDVRGSGILMGNYSTATECEAYNCNQGNVANLGGFATAVGSVFIRCLSHDNSGSNSHGFTSTGNTYFTLINCISWNNGQDGIWSNSSYGSVLYNCDSYSNGSNGVQIVGAAGFYTIQNCNFVKNGGFGILSTGTSASLRNGSIVNCGFGSGSVTNASGSISSNIGAINDIGSVLYSPNSTPWLDPVNANFKISLTEAKSAGRGAFTYYSTNSPTVAFPDIGAAQSASTNSTATGGGGSYTFAQ